ncbi:MAG: L-threonylcarbamoyladenylate synthase [Dongiaceae bacterium]
MTRHGDKATVTPERRGVVAPTADNIAIAARLLRDGELVAFPTETVYGLGADATNDHAVAAVFAAKGRPTFNPLIVHFSDAEPAREQVRFDERAHALAAAFWPGALTLVLQRRADSPVSLLTSAGLDTLAVRVPQHPVAHALLRACGCPIAAPSANLSGKLSPTAVEHVVRSFRDKVALILDGGRCPVGIESTVIDLSAGSALLLRPGGIAEERIEAVIGNLKAPDDQSMARAPGMLANHYAPDAPLRINAHKAQPGEGVLAYGPKPLVGGRVTLNLSPAGDLTEAAANLFAMLRSLDEAKVRAIAVMPIPDTGLGRAINDRLRRAASRRGDRP